MAEVGPVAAENGSGGADYVDGRTGGNTVRINPKALDRSGYAQWLKNGQLEILAQVDSVSPAAAAAVEPNSMSRT